MKRKGDSKRGRGNNPGLKRVKRDIEKKLGDELDAGDKTSSEDPRFRTLKSLGTSRKARRKEAKKESKKARRKRLKTKQENPKTKKKTAKTANQIAEEKAAKLQKAKKLEAKKKKAESERKQKELEEATKDDDIAISRLERLLKLKNRKSKNLPASFINDGLDYILDVCDSDKMSSGLLRDLDAEQWEGVSDQEMRGADDREDESEEGESASEVGEEEESAVEEDDDEMSDEVSDMSDEESDVNEEENGAKMDIYGRVKGEGGVAERSGSYVPPQKRAEMMEGSNREQVERLRKQLKGLVNRLSEAQIQPISSQIENMYRSYSRNDMNTSVSKLLLETCVSPAPLPERLAMEYTMLIALLHANVGNEVGANFVQELAREFDRLHRGDSATYGEGKQCHNTVVLFAHLYNFKVINCCLIYDIIQRMAERFTETDVEMLLLLLRHVGASLRKDDPASLKEAILTLQSKAAASSSSHQQAQDQSRMKFMLETISALKNNNMRKIPNYDPSHVQHLRKLLRGLLKDKDLGSSELRISLEDLLSADQRGRWWIVGSAWTGKLPNQTQTKEESESKDTNQQGQELQFSSQLLELSQKQRMNTDVRRNIFCVVMTSEDYLDAFEKLLRLSLKGSQTQEVIHVLLHCCLQERSYNPYYTHLANKLCHHQRTFQITLQCALWDKFKVLDQMSATQIDSMASLIIQLILTKGLSLSLFKVMQFSELDKRKVGFLRRVLLALLLHPHQAQVATAFARIAASQKLHVLGEGLRLFMRHFLLKKKSPGGSSDASATILKARIELAEQLLQSKNSSNIL